VVSYGYTLKYSRPYLSNLPLIIFLTFGHSGAQDWTPVPKCKKIKKRWVRPVWRWTLWLTRFTSIRKSVRLKGLRSVDRSCKLVMGRDDNIFDILSRYRYVVFIVSHQLRRQQMYEGYNTSNICAHLSSPLR